MFEALALLLVLGIMGRAGWGRFAGRDTAATLPAVLARAEADGIISPEQRRRILDLAPDDTRATHLSGATWLAAVAGLFVIAGVALVVASNWEQIGPAVRVVAFVAALAAIGEAAIRWRGRSLALALPLEMTWLFLPLVGIGLYGQTFQLSGDPISPFLVWLALAAPLAWLSPRPIAASLHTAALVTVLFIGNFLSAGMLALTKHGGMPVAATAWIVSGLILASVAVECVRLLPRGHRQHFLGVLAFWLFALLVAPTSVHMEHAGWLTIAALALATAWLVADLAAEGGTPERTTSIVVWLAAIYGATFYWHAGSSVSGTTNIAGMSITIAAVVAAVGGAMLLPGRLLSSDARWQIAGKILLAAPVLVSLLLLRDDVGALHLVAVAMNVLLIAIAVALVWHGAVGREPSQVNAGIAVLLTVLITRFIDVFGTLLQGGVGFIVAGVLLATLAYALDRARRRLIDLPEGVARS